MQQAKEVFVLSKYQKSAPQLSVALREGEKRSNQDTVIALRRVPLGIWYRVPLPADPNSVWLGGLGSSCITNGGQLLIQVEL